MNHDVNLYLFFLRKKRLFQYLYAQIITVPYYWNQNQEDFINLSVNLYKCVCRGSSGLHWTPAQEAPGFKPHG